MVDPKTTKKASTARNRRASTGTEEETVVARSRAKRPLAPNTRRSARPRADRASAKHPDAVRAPTKDVETRVTPPTTAQTVQCLDGVETRVASSPLFDAGPRSAASLCQTVVRSVERTEPAGTPLPLPRPMASPSPDSKKPRLLLFAAVAIAAVAIGGLAARRASAPPEPEAAVAVDDVEPSVRTLRLTSSPSGAEVYEASDRLGHTPIELTRPLGQRTQLRLVLEGRRTETRTFTFFRDDEAAVLLAVGDGLDYHHAP
jgi:hypothetical protein